MLSTTHPSKSLVQKLRGRSGVSRRPGSELYEVDAYKGLERSQYNDSSGFEFNIPSMASEALKQDAAQGEKVMFLFSKRRICSNNLSKAMDVIYHHMMRNLYTIGNSPPFVTKLMSPREYVTRKCTGHPIFVLGFESAGMLQATNLHRAYGQWY